MTGGILSGSDTLTVTGLTTWSGGTISGTGTTIAQGGLQLGSEDGTYQYDYLENGTFINAGTAIWFPTNALYEYDGATFDNQAGATIEQQENVTWYTDSSSRHRQRRDDRPDRRRQSGFVRGPDGRYRGHQCELRHPGLAGAWNGDGHLRRRRRRHPPA